MPHGCAIPFTKVHGLGNDFILIDSLAHPHLAALDFAALAPKWCDRHRAIGADGVLILSPSVQGAHARMTIVNSDGSDGGMCGNGIRCIARHMVEHHAHAADTLTIQTARGNLPIRIHRDTASRFTAAEVDMGEPILDAARITVLAKSSPVIDLELAGIANLRATCVSMGNPHAVFFVDDVAAIDLHRLGPTIEKHAAFPKATNVQFVQVLSPTHARVRTWERGTGPTLACGTGACAVLVAGVLTYRLSRAATLTLPGGDLRVKWDDQTGHVIMTGPAEEVFAGTITV